MPRSKHRKSEGVGWKHVWRRRSRKLLGAYFEPEPECHPSVAELYAVYSHFTYLAYHGDGDPKAIFDLLAKEVREWPLPITDAMRRSQGLGSFAESAIADALEVR